MSQIHLLFISFSVAIYCSSSVIVTMNKVFQFFAGLKDEAAGNVKPANPNYDLLLAIEKTKRFVSSNGNSLSDICLAVECAESMSTLEAALLPFNRVMRIFRTALPEQEQKNLIVDALTNLNCSRRLINYLESAINIHDGLLGYKTAVVKKLNIDLTRIEDLRRTDNAFDESLLISHLTKRYETRMESGRTVETKDNQDAVVLTKSPSQKRNISLVLESKNEDQSKDVTPERSGLHRQVYQDHPYTNKRARRGYSDQRRRSRDIASEEDRDNTCHHYKNGNCRRGQKCRKIHSD